MCGETPHPPRIWRCASTLGPGPTAGSLRLREEVRRRHAVLLLRVPVSVSPRNRAGVCRRAAVVAALRHPGADGRLADFLRRVETGLSAAAARLDRIQFLAR